MTPQLNQISSLLQLSGGQNSQALNQVLMGTGATSEGAAQQFNQILSQLGMDTGSVTPAALEALARQLTSGNILPEGGDALPPTQSLSVSASSTALPPLSGEELLKAIADLTAQLADPPVTSATAAMASNLDTKRLESQIDEQVDEPLDELTASVAVVPVDMHQQRPQVPTEQVPAQQNASLLSSHVQAEQIPSSIAIATDNAGIDHTLEQQDDLVTMRPVPAEASQQENVLAKTPVQAEPVPDRVISPNRNDAVLPRQEIDETERVRNTAMADAVAIAPIKPEPLERPAVVAEDRVDADRGIKTARETSIEPLRVDTEIAVESAMTASQPISSVVSPVIVRASIPEKTPNNQGVLNTPTRVTIEPTPNDTALAEMKPAESPTLIRTQTTSTVFMQPANQRLAEQENIEPLSSSENGSRKEATLGKLLESATLGGSHQPTLIKPSPEIQARMPVGMTPTHPQWQQAVSERVVWAAGQHVQTAIIQLDPPELGSLHVKLQVTQDGVNVSFTSPHANVRDAVDQSIPRLRDMMAEQGLDLTDSFVGDQSSSQGQSEQRRGTDTYTGTDEKGQDNTQQKTAAYMQNLNLVDYYA